MTNPNHPADQRGLTSEGASGSPDSDDFGLAEAVAERSRRAEVEARAGSSTADVSRDGRTEITVPVGQPGAGATNGGSASVEAETLSGDGTGELRAKLIEDLRGALVREPEEVGETGVDQWYVSDLAVDCDTDPLLRVLARGLLAAGWRPGAEQLTRDDRRGLAAVFGYDLGDADARRELEAAGWRPPLPGSETEWGYRSRDDQFVVDCGEQDARKAAEVCPQLYDLVCREVGPWTEVQS